MRPDHTLLKLVLPASLLLLPGCDNQLTIKMGAVLPLTGPSSMYGQSVNKGIELGFERVKQDTTFEHIFELDIRDSGSDPQKAAQLGAELFEGTIGVIGGVTSAEALAMVPAARETDRLFLVPSASTDKLSNAGRTVFRLFTTTLSESSVMATFVDDTLRSQTATIVRASGPPADGFTDGFLTGFENLGGEITTVIEIDATSDVNDIVEQVLEADADAVYLVLEGAVLPQLIVALREAGVGGGDSGAQKWILSTSSLSSGALIAEAGSAAEDVYISQSVFDLASENGEMPTFVEAYRAKYGEEPDLYAGHGYDAVLLLAEASRNIVTTIPTELLKGIRSIETFAASSAIELKFNEDGDAQKFPRIHWIDNGSPRDFQKAMTDRQNALKKEMDELRERMLKARQDASD
jgi:branched-chain amino acid transport system substrate-binding protein